MHETRNFFEAKRLKKVPDFDFTLFLGASFYCIFIYNSLMFFIILRPFKLRYCLYVK